MLFLNVSKVGVTGTDACYLSALTHDARHQCYIINTTADVLFGGDRG